MGFNIPSNGVKLGKAPVALGDDKNVKQVFRLKFQDENLLEELRKAAGPIKVAFGKNKALIFGKHTFNLTPASGSSHRSEVYTREGRNLNCVGLATHSFNVVDKARPSDEATDALAAQFAALNQKKLANQTKAVSMAELKVTGKDKHSKFSLKAQRPVGKQQQSLNDIIAKPQAPKKRKEVSDGELALKKVLMFLLAAGPESEKKLAATVRTTPEFCNDVILRHKIANRNNLGNQWILVDDFYKEMDLWGFPYKEDGTREAALEKALDAFERLRVPKDSEIRQILLKPEERGKATPPSRTKQKSPPRIAITDVKGSTSAQPSPTFPKTNGGEPMARSSSNPVPKKKVQDPISRMIANKGKPPKKVVAKGTAAKEPARSTPKEEKIAPRAPKKATGAAAKAAAVNSAKIKSAEFIEDSDDDAFQTSPKGQPAAPASTSSRSSSLRVDSDVEMRDVPPSKKLSPVKRKISPAPKTHATAAISASPAVRSNNTTPRPKQPAATNGKISKPVSKTSSQANGIKRKSPPEPSTSRYSPPEPVSKPSPLGQSNVTASDMASSPSSVSSSPALTMSTRTASPYDSARQKYTSSAPAPAERKRKYEGSSTSTGKVAKRPKFDIEKNIIDLAKRFKDLYPRYLKKFDQASKIQNPRLREEKMQEVNELAAKLSEMKQNITDATIKQQRAYELSIRG